MVHGARVVTLEPNRRARELLERNVARNRVQDLVTVRAEALGAVEGRGSMTDQPGNLGGSRLVEGDDGPVGVVALDSLRVPAPDLVKIDVEGHEPEVIRGAATVLGSARPVVWVEAWTPEARRGLRSELRRIGYRVPPMAMGPGKVQFVPDRHSVDRIAGDARFVVRGAGVSPVQGPGPGRGSDTAPQPAAPVRRSGPTSRQTRPRVSSQLIGR